MESKQAIRVLETVGGTPAENLAYDEALLGAGVETLHLWESPAPCVVLGRSGSAGSEVHLEACARAGIPVLRRASGGGAVVLAPGCLTYALCLSLDRRPHLAPVAASYRAILGWLAGALGISGLEVQGSDVLYEDRKVAGCAQRRIRGWLLHHGTVLTGLDLDLIERLLPEPPRQPLHRRGRTHRHFLGALPLTTAEASARLWRAAAAWK